MRIVLGLVVLLLMLTGCVRGRKHVADIADVGRSFSEAFVRGDPAAMAAVYTENAVLLPPGGRAVRGRQAIERYWTSGPRRRQVAHAMVSDTVEVTGDVAIDLGTWHSTVSVDGSEPVSSSGRYLMIWRRVSGEWHIQYDMWHRPSE